MLDVRCFAFVFRGSAARLPAMKTPLFCRIAAALILLISMTASAAITLPPMFGDHMVLQRGMAVPVWGKANPNEHVTVEFAGRKVTATADEKGDFVAKLPAMELGSAASLSVSGAVGKPKVFEDVIVGDVWVCSGQSNMGFLVKQGKDAAKEIDAAKYPNIRFFRVPTVTSTQPTKELHAAWEVCSPKAAGDSSAVAYFFGRDISEMEKVPVGLIQNAWGGMPAESFTSEEALKSDPDFAPLLARKKQPSEKDAENAKKQFEVANKQWEKRYLRKDEGNKGLGEGWAKPDADESDWKAMKLPQHWEDTGLKIDGAVWFRKEIEIPAAWAGKELTLTLGGIDDTDNTYFNGVEVGKTEGQLAVLVQRKYTVPADLAKAGKAVIAVRVFDMMSDGGFYGPGVAMQLGAAADDAVKPISLEGEWKYKVEKAFDQPASVPPRPPQPAAANAPFLASNIYNAMVYPIIPYAIKGAIWYQGESNADRAEQYRKLFPTMIRDWRNQWKQGEFPFLFVQLANFGNGHPRPMEPGDSNWAELREAQSMTLVAVPNTGMAVTVDIGDGKDIHPKNKQDVGKRLALSAEKVAYAKGGVEYSGPMYEVMKVEGGKIRVTFDHAKGLKTKDGQPPKGFQIAGKDEKFVWAEAKIDGSDVIVWSDQVEAPVSVRYGWGDDPVVSLYNGAELPASPFRTDDWKMVTAGKK
jgi:sialate O-acetylesterase